MFKALCGAAAAFAVVGFAGAASAATQLDITSAGMYDRLQTTLSGPVDRTVLAGPVKFTGTSDGTPFTLWAFCVDVFAPLTVGYGTQKTVDFTYRSGFLTSDGAGNALTPTQIMKISDLAGYGFSLIGSGEADLRYKLGAIQIAIWKLEYADLTATMSAKTEGYVNQFLANAGTYGRSATYIYDVTGQNQGMMVPGDSDTIGFPGVPEPTTWALMISGFGAVGYSLRRRRYATAA